MRLTTSFVRSAALAGMAIVAMACSSSNDSNPVLQLPSAYDSSAYATNAAPALAARTSFEAFVKVVNAGRTTAIDAGALATTWPAVKSASDAYYGGLIDGWLPEAVKASAGDSFDFLNPSGEGGRAGGYLFDENGIEIEQLVDKGLFSAMHYRAAAAILRSENPTLAGVDQAVAYFGASPAFANSPTVAKVGSNADKFSANYAARRDPNDGTGVYTRIRAAFIKAQAALKGGDAFKADYRAAVDTILINWERALAATVVNYYNSSKGKFTMTNPTPADMASGLHALSECIGFIHGMKGIPQTHRKVTDAQIDQLLTLMKAPAGGTPSVLDFVKTPATAVPSLEQALAYVQTTWGFTAAEMESFKSNWVSVQNR